MMSQQQILDIRIQSVKQLAEAKALLKKEKRYSLAWDTNRSIMTACKAEIDLIDKILSGNSWIVILVDSYWYKSGRNYDTYVEITYWVNNEGERKETTRSETITSGDYASLPDWAKTIKNHNRKLDNF